MKKPLRKYFWKNLLVHVGTVSAILSIGFFMYSLEQGGLHAFGLRMRSLALTLPAALIEVDLVPMPYDVPMCTPGALPANMMIILSKPDTASVYLVKDNNTATAQPAKLNTPFYLDRGTYTLTTQLFAGFTWSGRSKFSFVVDKICDSTISPNTPPPSNSLGGVATGTASSSATLSPALLPAASSTSSAPTLPPVPLPAVNTVFSLGNNYPTDWSILPTIFKDNVRVYSGVGQVVFQLEAPSDKVMMLFGSPDGWTTGGVFGPDQGLKQVPRTHRFMLPFDTRKFPDGNYRVAGAYFVLSDGWKFTGSTDFKIINAVPIPPTVPPRATSTINTIATSSEQYNPAWKPTTSTVTSVAEIAPTFVPTLRLVVDDRQVTTLGYVFDREQLEVRATTMPAQSVQFLALSLDGAFKPAIKELGKGGRDELLSRDGKEVWTYTVDMSEFPTGNYRLFARVHTLNNKVQETAPSSISVQHLNQLGTSPNPSLSAENLPPATATREQILLRVQDPSTCQNRQECQVYCSSSSVAAQKCADFARVVGAAGYDGANIRNDILRLQAGIRDQFSGKFAEYLARAAYTGTSTVAIGGTSSTTSASTTPLSGWDYLSFTGRPSLADVLPKPVLDATVANPLKMASELPADVRTSSDFLSYCGTVEHAERCAKIITNIAPDLAPALKKQEENVQRVEQHDAQIIEQRTGARIFTDTDGDGISDYDEINIFHTDPTKRDSFSSGYSDGAMLLSQSNGQGEVIGTSTNSNIVLGGSLAVENPKVTGTTQSKILSVASVAVVELKDTPDGKKDVAKALFKGKALPNSFVKVFLFSDPIVVTVKTDDQGNWSYILDKTLPDGAHTAYVAMVDNGGRILAKSAPLPFVKEASALTVEAAGPGIAPVSENSGMFGGLSPLSLMALIVGILGLGLSVIGAVIGLRHPTKIDPDAEYDIK